MKPTMRLLLIGVLLSLSASVHSETGQQDKKTSEEKSRVTKNDETIPLGEMKAKDFEAYAKTIRPEMLSERFHEKATEAWGALQAMYEQRFDGKLFFKMAESDAQKEISKLKLVAKIRPEHAVARVMREYILLIGLVRLEGEEAALGGPASNKELYQSWEKKGRALLMQMLLYEDSK